MYGSLNKSKELYPNIIHTNWTYTCSKSEALILLIRDSSSWFSNQCPQGPSKTTFPNSKLLEIYFWSRFLLLVQQSMSTATVQDNLPGLKSTWMNNCSVDDNKLPSPLWYIFRRGYIDQNNNHTHTHTHKRTGERWKWSESILQPDSRNHPMHPRFSSKLWAKKQN